MSGWAGFWLGLGIAIGLDSIKDGIVYAVRHWKEFNR